MATIQSLSTEAIIALVNSGTWPTVFPTSQASLTLLGDTFQIDTSIISNVVFHVKNTGTVTMAAGAFIFEGSVDSITGVDGTWFALQAVRSNANTPELGTGTLGLANAAASTYAWKISTNALEWVRVRCTTALTANSVATWTAARGSYATESIPAIQTHAVTGSGSFITTPVAANAATLVSTATTNAAVLKSSAAKLFEITVFNPTAAVVYVKLYNKTTAPTVGTDVPLVVFPVVANGLIGFEFGALGKTFTAGLAIAITAGPLATDVAAVAAGVNVSATII